MGLDIYILRVRKHKELPENRLFNEGDLPIEGLLFESMTEHNLNLIKELIPYGDIVKVRKRLVNKTEAIKYLGLNSYSYAYLKMDGSILVCDDDYKHHEIPMEEAEKFIYTSDEDYLVCEKEEVAYWRGNHEVSDFFYDNINKEVENTGYYKLDTEILQKFNKKARKLKSKHLPVEEPTEEYALFYNLSY